MNDNDDVMQSPVSYRRVAEKREYLVSVSVLTLPSLTGVRCGGRIAAYIPTTSQPIRAESCRHQPMGASGVGRSF